MTTENSTGKRARETRYPAHVAARVSASTAAGLEALADREGVALGIVVRRILDAGLRAVETARQSALDEARRWWEALDKHQRREWRQRLAPLNGRDLIGQAWRQAHDR